MRIALRILGGFLGLACIATGLLLLYMERDKGFYSGIVSPVSLMLTGCAFAFYGVTGRSKLIGS